MKAEKKEERKGGSVTALLRCIVIMVIFDVREEEKRKRRKGSVIALYSVWVARNAVSVLMLLSILYCLHLVLVICFCFVKY